MTASAPGKAILFGEHAINRGQAAISLSVGLYAECQAGFHSRFHFRSGTKEQVIDRLELLELGRSVETCRATDNFEAIRRLAAEDYFAPQKYILASAFGESLPAGLSLEWHSEVPSASGLGSGGSAFVAMVAAVSELLWRRKFHEPSTKAHESRITNHESNLESRRLSSAPTLEQRAAWAHRGDIVAHGGIASALDTQTSLLGGVIRFTGKGLAEPVKCAPGLTLVIAHTGVSAPTSEVNTRVRKWLAEQPEVRVEYFQAMGNLTRAARPALQRGDWPELGRLMTLNQFLLEKIGVSCIEIDRLIVAARAAGAHGAKLSGSGGGGIIIALASTETKSAVAEALARAGGRVFTPEIAVPGVTIHSNHELPDH